MTAGILSLLLALLPQSGAPPSADRGEIRGRVVDRETGRPLPGAVVHLANRDRHVGLTAKADDAGVFRFVDLPPGHYDGFADDGPFRGTHDMQFFGSPAPGRTIELGKDEIREIQVALPRAYAIDVRVLDSDGDPLSEVRVTVRRADGAGTFASAPGLRSTDDRGLLRVFGLAAGRYRVCAEAEALGQSASSGSVRRDRLLRTCYPSAANDEQADVITVDRADVGELEIRMRRGRTYTVAGRIVDASGAPAAGVSAQFSQFERNSSSGSGVIVDADGRFRIANVHPGGYAIEVSLGGRDRPEQRRPFEAGFLPVQVSDADVEDLLVTMKKGVDVSGRVVLDDASQPFPVAGGSGFMIAARLTDDRLPGTGSTRHAIMRTDQTFTLSGVFGRRALRFDNVPRGWYVKSVRYGERDVIDEPIEVKDGGEGVPLEVVLSNRGAVVSGRAVDDRGQPARAMVVAFRIGDGNAATLAATATTAATGAFRFGPLRGGSYRIVALPPATTWVESAEWERIARLAALGDRLTLGEMDDRTIELTIVPERKDRLP